MTATMTQASLWDIDFALQQQEVNQYTSLAGTLLENVTEISSALAKATSSCPEVAEELTGILNRTVALQAAVQTVQNNHIAFSQNHQAPPPVIPKVIQSPQLAAQRSR